MSLIYKTEPDEKGRRHVACEVCNRKWLTHWPIERIHHACESQNPAHGPGTELSVIFRELGITGKCGQGCPEWIAKMNAWLPDGCREHRTEIIEHLTTAYNSADVLTKLKAGANALVKGLPLSLDGLLELAIERAEATESKGADKWQS
jgi:hypothetical protein